MTAPRITVVIPTRNPNRERLAEVFAGLHAQDLPSDEWQLCLVDNGSTPPLEAEMLQEFDSAILLRESRAGLLWARLAGLQHTDAPLLVFIDDDTIPHPQFLSAALRFMETHPRVATAGGKIIPRYLSPPPPWLSHAGWALALRDNGPSPLVWAITDGGDLPHWTPIGAGLIVRRAALVPDYIDHVTHQSVTIERISWKGQGCGGVEDKDLVLHCIRRGWQTGYTPDATLTHIIPPNRLEFSYFQKLIPAVQELWAQTLMAHGLSPHAPVSPITLPLRKLKAWFAFRAWRSSAAKLQWLSACGFLTGLANATRNPVHYPAPGSPSQN